MTSIRPKTPRIRLEPEAYALLQRKILSATTGSVRTVVAGSTFRFTTRNFEVIPETTQKKTS
jgi:hypothetical protein